MKKLYIFLLFYTITSCLPKAKNTGTNHGDGPENPIERLEWIWARKGKEATVENYQLAKAIWEKKFSMQQKSRSTRDAGISGWTEMGPFGIGGRIKSIAVDPQDNNHIFIGSAGGGMWTTDDGGTTWSVIDDFMPSLAISQIQYDPFNQDIMYASTGEGLFAGGTLNMPGFFLPGAGVFKSVDGGENWVQMPSPPQNFIWVNDIVLDPANQDWIYAVTSNGGKGNFPTQTTGSVFRSTDGGENWSLLATTSSSALDIKIDPNDSDNIMVGCSSHLYRSQNATANNPNFSLISGGMNQIPNGGRIEIAYAPSVNNMVYASVEGDSSEIWRTTNGGTSWQLRNNTSNFLKKQGWYDNVIWVDPSNSNRILVGGVDMWRSTDGGTTLNKISAWTDDINGNQNGGNNSIHADQHVITPFNNYNGNNNNGIFIGNDGGIYSTNNIWTVSTNNGWLSNVGNLAITQFYGGAISPDGQIIIGGAQDNSFNVSQNGGVTWSQPRTGDGAYSAIDYNNTQFQYANTNNNSLWRSINNGVTWNQMPQVADSASLISVFTMDPNTPTVLLAGARQLWRYTNVNVVPAIVSIKPTIPAAGPSPKISAIDIATGNSAIIWVGYNNGRLERTSNTGNNWSGNISPAITSGLPIPQNPYVTDICINPNNSNEVIVSYGGYNQVNLFYSSNANAQMPTWMNINTGIPLQINSIEWHPTNANWIYVGTDFGILASENKGEDWSITPLYNENGHEGPVNTEVSQIFWQRGSKRLCAATHGRGIWRSDDIHDKLYVDKNQDCGPMNMNCQGTFNNPYNRFTDALAVAGTGTEIIFLSSGIHEEVAQNQQLIVRKKIRITLQNGNIPIVIR